MIQIHILDLFIMYNLIEFLRQKESLIRRDKSYKIFKNVYRLR